MAIIRVEKNANYSVMSNCHLDDRRLSLKAIGLMSKMLRLPDDWDYSVAGLTHICKEGRDAIITALKELEVCGYLERCQAHNSDGLFDGYDYIVRESPTEAGEPPFTENPSTEKPFTENPQQPNTNSTKYVNNPPKAPRKRREPKAAPEWKPERFAAFWDSYPRGESKQAAIAAWDRLKPDDELLVVMAKALKRQMLSEAWQDGIGIPYASTWLNGRRWTDEPKRTIVPPEDNGGLQRWT